MDVPHAEQDQSHVDSILFLHGDRERALIQPQRAGYIAVKLEQTPSLERPLDL